MNHEELILNVARAADAYTAAGQALRAAETAESNANSALRAAKRELEVAINGQVSAARLDPDVVDVDPSPRAHLSLK
jgi:hypothetical protein